MSVTLSTKQNTNTNKEEDCRTDFCIRFVDGTAFLRVVVEHLFWGMASAFKLFTPVWQDVLIALSIRGKEGRDMASKKKKRNNET